MLFRKRFKKNMQLTLDPNQFCTVWEAQNYECAYKFTITTQAIHYNLFFQNGVFLGQPLPNGGLLYPFSKNPIKKGSRAQKRKIVSAKVICLSNQFVFKIKWGINDFTLHDRDGRDYLVGASGVIYAKLDPTDDQSPNKFYRSLLSQFDSSKMTTEAVCNYLKEAFENEIGDAIEKTLANYPIMLGDLTALTPSQKLEIRDITAERVHGIFDHFGCTIDMVASRNSFLGGLSIRPSNLVKPRDK